jgi:hypothetical protein
MERRGLRSTLNNLTMLIVIMDLKERELLNLSKFMD